MQEGNKSKSWIFFTDRSIWVSGKSRSHRCSPGFFLRFGNWSSFQFYMLWSFCCLNVFNPLNFPDIAGRQESLTKNNSIHIDILYLIMLCIVSKKHFRTFIGPQILHGWDKSVKCVVPPVRRRQQMKSFMHMKQLAAVKTRSSKTA